MHTVEIMELALSVADRMGYQIRQEWLGGSGGGACEFGGQKWLFVDLALNSVEQLEQVTEALMSDPGIYLVDLPDVLRRQMGIRRAA